MVVPYRTAVFESRPPGVTVRAWREIKTETYRQVGQMWFENYLPLHFQRNAATRYRYQPRDATYLAKKRKAARSGKAPRKAEYNLLIFSGLMEREIMAQATFRAYPSRFTVRMVVPGYVTQRSRRGKPNLAAEAMAIHPTEADAMREKAQTVGTQKLAAFSSPQTTTIN